MQQVFDNLLNNAMKFTPTGGSIRVVAVARGDKAQGGPWLEVRVSDTGAGIPPEEVERIFDRFYQSPHHQDERHRGSGLGLAIARYIVEAHGGRIWAESKLGRGATFIVVLPLYGVHEIASPIGYSEVLQPSSASMPLSVTGEERGP
jgi:signal transduction histidine kinase